MSSPARVREIALALPEAEEKPHFDRASFRVRNKIFATLAEGESQAVVKLTVADQTALIAAHPDIFHLVGWAQQGWTGIHLQAIDDALTASVVESAWRNVAPKKLVAERDGPG